MSNHILLCCRTFLLTQLCLVTPICYNPLPSGPLRVTETNSSMSIHLYAMNSTNSKLTFIVKPFNGVNSYNFSKHFTMNVFTGIENRLYLIIPIDLDINLNTSLNFEGGVELQVIIVCKDFLTSKTVNYTRRLSVDAVDEYAPVFKNPPNYLIREDYPSNKTFANLREMIFDPDLHDSTSEIDFSEVRIPVPFDGPEQPFLLLSNGDVFLTRSLDYEKGDREFYHIVGVYTRNHASTTEVLTIKVLNVNDNPANFVYSECSTECYLAHYEIILQQSAIGVIEQFSARPILAKDADGDRIEYYIVAGSPLDYRKYVTINNSTGVISLLVRSAKIVGPLIDLVVKAKSISTLPTSKRTEPQSETYTFVLLWIEDRRHIFGKHGMSSAPNYTSKSLYFFGIILVVGASLKKLHVN